MIREREIKAEIAANGAKATAQKFKECLEDGKLTNSDFPSLRLLYENFVYDKNNDKVSLGREILSDGTSEQWLKEEAGALSSIDAFSHIASQLFFNALTSVRDSADFNVAPRFKVIPSSLVRGETFAGVSNMDLILQPTPENKPLPYIEPTEDYVQSCPQLQTGGIVPVTLSLMRGDRTGEIMNLMENLTRAIAAGREIEACQTLANLGSCNPRTNYKWKGVSYATYQSSTPWINAVSSNALLNYENLQAAYLTAQSILDPFTNLPMSTSAGRMSLVVTPTNEFIADRLARGIQYQTSSLSLSTDRSPLVVTDAQPPRAFDVISSKYLSYVLSQNSGAQTTWYLGWLDKAFSWNQMFPITTAEAIPGAGQLFERNLAAAYKCFRYETSFVFDPRYVIENTA